MPSASFRSLTCIDWPFARLPRSTVRYSGSCEARHCTSSSVTTWLTRHLSVLTAGEFSSLTKCSGIFFVTFVVASTRWKSMCITIGLNACIW